MDSSLPSKALDAAPRHVWRVSLAVLLLLAGLVLLFEWRVAGSILPGVRVVGVELGGLSMQQAALKLSEALKVRGVPPVRVLVGEHQVRLNPNDLGWQADLTATLGEAWRLGRQGHLLERVLVRVRSVLGGADLPLRVRANPQLVHAALGQATARFKLAATDAQLLWEVQHFVVKSERAGQSLKLEEAVQSYLQNPNLETLTVQLQPLNARRTAAQLNPLAAQANALLRPLRLLYTPPVKADGTPRTTLERRLVPAELAELIGLADGTNGPQLLFKPAALRALLERVQVFDQPVRNARYVRKLGPNGQLQTKPEQQGWRLDLKAAETLLAQTLWKPDSFELALPVVAQDPALRLANLPAPESLSLLAEATTTYFGSSTERMANVAAAMNKLDGLVVPAGEDFDFNAAVGPIEVENGFAEALVIASGRTVKGVGGGVCQASTTTFRALYKAGLPVVERHPHAYRVHWYDPVVGMDAAVYQPSLNLRMRNDTDGPILLRTETTPGRTTTRVYGLPSDRTVRISDPLVFARTPHPPPAFEFDWRLPVGVRKQIDWAVDGLRTRVTRTVSDAHVSRTDVLRSNYRPWRAVYALGPRR